MLDVKVRDQQQHTKTSQGPVWINSLYAT